MRELRLGVVFFFLFFFCFCGVSAVIRVCFTDCNLLIYGDFFVSVFT